MTKKTTPKSSLTASISDGVFRGLRRVRRLIVPELLEYAPLGWDTPLDEGEKGWLSGGVLDSEREKWDRFTELLRLKGPLGFSHEAATLREVDDVAFHNLNYVYGSIVLRSAFGLERLSILDWGGGLGHYSLLAKAFLPRDFPLDYHCKDVPTLVELGREVAPDITWHEDDSCLEAEYDLVMVSGALQYCRDWRDLLRRMRKATKRYFYLTRTPVVQDAASFLAVQRAYGTKMLHLQFNERELLAELENLGLNLEREVALGDRIYIKNAPEDALLKGWIFSV